jgi:hypothetical protein
MDEAVFIGSSNSDTETFEAGLDEGTFFQGKDIDKASYVTTAKNFPAVYAWPKGGYDEAYFEDSPRADAYKATWIYGLMQYTREDGTKYKRRATKFDKYLIDSVHGGDDSARLFGCNYNDLLQATPTESRWLLAYREKTGKAKHEHIIKNFRTVMPRGWDPDGYSPDTDHDAAHIWTNPGDIYKELGNGEAQIHDDPESYKVWVKGFDEVREGDVPRTAGPSALLGPASARGFSDTDFASLAHAQSQNDINEEDEDEREATALVMESDIWWEE